MNAIVETVSYIITGTYSPYHEKELRPYILLSVFSLGTAFVLNATKLISLLLA